MGEAELLAEDDSASSRDNSRDESIEEEDFDVDRTASSGYVTFQPPGAPGYTHMTQAGWQQRPVSPPETRRLPYDGDELPPGYSKMVAAPMAAEMPAQEYYSPNRGYVMSTSSFASAEPQQQPRKNNAPAVGYVAFEQVRGQQQPQPQILPQAAVAPQQGYITLAQAGKMTTAPQMLPPPVEAPPGAYHRVGLGLVGQPQQLPHGYVRPGVPQQVLVASSPSASRPVSQLSEKEIWHSGRPLSLAESVSEQQRQVSCAILCSMSVFHLSSHSPPHRWKKPPRWACIPRRRWSPPGASLPPPPPWHLRRS